MPRIGAAEHGKLELFLDYILKSERHRLIGLGSGAMPIRAGEGTTATRLGAKDLHA